MRYRANKLNVSHSLSSNFGLRYFNSAVRANDALKANFIVFSTGAHPILSRSENLLAEESVSFRLESSVVDSLRLCYLTVRPLKHLLC